MDKKDRRKSNEVGVRKEGEKDIMKEIVQGTGRDLQIGPVPEGDGKMD